MGAQMSHETYESINPDINDGYKYSATFSENYFAEGSNRYAFKGTLSGNGPRNGSKCVTKVFKSEVAKHYIEWAPDLAASKRAKIYAEKFAEKCFPTIRNFITGQEIEFLIPLIARVKSLKRFDLLWLIPILQDDRYVKVYSHVAIEPFIEGKYEKFNSNGGWEDRLHDLMTAFCHWTYTYTGHKYMVCDLQGVKTGNKYLLTDPAIHSAAQEFGPTDLGTEGMAMVLGDHQCNNLCRQLGLYDEVCGTVQGVNRRRPTSYTYQITEQEMLRAQRMIRDYRLGPIQE